MHLQTQADIYTFPYRISYENWLKYDNFLLFDHFLNSHNLLSWLEKIDFGYSCGLKGHVMYVTYYRQFYSSEVNTPQVKAEFNFLLKLAVNFSNWEKLGPTYTRTKLRLSSFCDVLCQS